MNEIFAEVSGTLNNSLIFNEGVCNHIFESILRLLRGYRVLNPVDPEDFRVIKESAVSYGTFQKDDEWIVNCFIFKHSLKVRDSFFLYWLRTGDVTHETWDAWEQPFLEGIIVLKRHLLWIWLGWRGVGHRRTFNWVVAIDTASEKHKWQVENLGVARQMLVANFEFNIQLLRATSRARDSLYSLIWTREKMLCQLPRALFENHFLGGQIFSWKCWHAFLHIFRNLRHKLGNIRLVGHKI